MLGSLSLSFPSTFFVPSTSPSSSAICFANRGSYLKHRQQESKSEKKKERQKNSFQLEALSRLNDEKFRIKKRLRAIPSLCASSILQKVRSLLEFAQIGLNPPICRMQHDETNNLDTAFS